MYPLPSNRYKHIYIMAKEIENININGEVYEVGKIYSKMGLSFERFVELLGRDLYCPTLPQAPTSSTVSYKDTDDTVNTFQAGQPCRWQEGNAWRLAVCTNNIGTSATWYVLPTKVSELTNDAEYVTESELEEKGYATKGEVPADYLGFENVGIEVEDSVEYLTTSQQSLSDDEKERVKSNIGVNVPIVEHGTGDSTFALTPNKYHRWGTMSSLTLTLASPNDTSVVNNYAFEFTSGGTATTLLVPSSIQWVNDITVEAGKRYQGIVNNGVGVLVSVSNE